MVKLSANIAGFLFLLLAFLLLIGMQLLLVSSLESKMENLQQSYGFWSRGIHLDLLNRMEHEPRSEVMATLQRELTRTRQGCCGEQGSALRKAARACAGQRSSCGELKRQMEEISGEVVSRFTLFSSGGNLVLVALALAFLGLGGTLAWMARGSLRLLAVLGALCWSSSLGLQIHLFSSANRQVLDSTAVARLVTRTRLAITLPARTMKTELDRVLVKLRQAKAIPPPQRGPLELALRKCIHAASLESAWQTRCKRAAALSRAPKNRGPARVPVGCHRLRVSPVVVACPRVMIPLARANVATRAAPDGANALVWLVSWLQVSSVLLLLLLLLLAGMSRRWRRRQQRR